MKAAYLGSELSLSSSDGLLLGQLGGGGRDIICERNVVRIE